MSLVKGEKMAEWEKQIDGVAGLHYGKICLEPEGLTRKKRTAANKAAAAKKKK